MDQWINGYCAGFVESWQSRPSTESKPVESPRSTPKSQPSSSELYDPLEGTESDNEDDDVAPTASVSSSSISSIYSAAPGAFGVVHSSTAATQSFAPISGFPPLPASAPAIPFPRPYPGISDIPMPGMALAPNLPGRPPIPIPGQPHSMLPSSLPVPARPMSRFPSHIPPTPAHVPPVTITPSTVSQLPVSTTSVPPATAAASQTTVTVSADGKSLSTPTVSKNDPSKRRFTEEKEEDGVPDNLFGYQVDSFYNVYTLDCCDSV